MRSTLPKNISIDINKELDTLSYRLIKARFYKNVYKDLLDEQVKLTEQWIETAKVLQAENMKLRNKQ